MNKRLKALHDKLQSLIDRQQALLALDEWTDEQRAEADALPQQIAEVKRQIEGVNQLATAGADADQFLNGSQAEMVAVGAGAGLAGAPAPQPRRVPTSIDDLTRPQGERPVRVLGPGRVRNFRGATEGEAREKAYRFGMWLIAAVRGNHKAVEFCKAEGIPIQRGVRAADGHIEDINEDGGYLVPPEFERDLIILREQFGVFRRFARPEPMTSNTKLVPRRETGLEAYFVGEAGAAEKSKMGWDQVNLVAKKLMVIAKFSSELDEDAIVQMGDTLAGEIAYSFAKKEDFAGFNGDGTSAYGGIVGVRAKLRAVDGTIGNIAGLQVASGNTWDEYELEDFNFLVGRLPQYADTPNTGWFCHKRFYHGVMERLMLASGGVTAAEVAAGRRNPVFMGYPVHISQAMPSSQANSQIECIFGDLSLGAIFGDRRATTIALSEHAAFETDELMVRGTERFDINVHSVGNTTEAGPLVGLISAAG